MSPPTRRSRPAGNGPARSSSGHHRDTPESTPPHRQTDVGAREPSLDDALAEARALTEPQALAEARALRDEGAEAAELSLHTGWRLWAEAELQRLADSGEPFTADQLRAIVGAPPDGQHINGIGGLFITASRRGLIRPVGYEQSRRREAHGRAVRVWRGVQ